VSRFAQLVALSAVLYLVAVGPVFAAPSRAEFIRRGDALCTQAQRELVPLAQRAKTAKSLPKARQWAAATRLWSDQIRIQVRFSSRFRSLGTPAGDAKARGLVSGFVRGLSLARRVRDAFAARSTRSLASTLPAYLRFTVSLNRRVAAYGFKVCGR
jgi:hypothetical protein